MTTTALGNAKALEGRIIARLTKGTAANPTADRKTLARVRQDIARLEGERDARVAALIAERAEQAKADYQHMLKSFVWVLEGDNLAIMAKKPYDGPYSYYGREGATLEDLRAVLAKEIAAGQA